MTSWFHTLGISDVWQLIVAVMVFLMLPGPGTFCVLTCTRNGGLRGGFASLAGNAAARRLARNRRIAAFATKAAGVFLIGFGLKLTTN